MKNPKISIIVPVYKVEKYLENSVSSIQNQTYKNLEIILIDDGSPDGCPALCDKIAKSDKRVKVLHIENKGVSNARNKGLEIATGDLITFLDSDDRIDETMYEKMLAKQQETDADLVFARFHYEYENDKPSRRVKETALEEFCKTRDIKFFFNHTSNNDLVGNDIVINNNVMCNIWRVLFKKSAINGINFPLGVTFMEDVIFLSKILKDKDKKLAFVDEYLHYYLIRSTSAVRTKAKNVLENSKKYLENINKVLTGSAFEKYLPALEYFCYAECIIAKLTSNIKINLSEIKAWGSKQNYKINKTITIGKKQKIKYFLIQHKLFWLLKLIYKIK